MSDEKPKEEKNAQKRNAEIAADIYRNAIRQIEALGFRVTHMASLEVIGDE